MGLNHRPTVYETVALPLSYAGPGSLTSQGEKGKTLMGSPEKIEGLLDNRSHFIPFLRRRRQLSSFAFPEKAFPELVVDKNSPIS